MIGEYEVAFLFIYMTDIAVLNFAPSMITGI